MCFSCPFVLQFLLPQLVWTTRPREELQNMHRLSRTAFDIGIDATQLGLETKPWLLTNKYPHECQTAHDKEYDRDLQSNDQARDRNGFWLDASHSINLLKSKVLDITLRETGRDIHPRVKEEILKSIQVEAHPVTSAMWHDCEDSSKTIAVVLNGYPNPTGVTEDFNRWHADPARQRAGVQVIFIIRRGGSVGLNPLPGIRFDETGGKYFRLVVGVCALNQHPHRLYTKPIEEIGSRYETILKAISDQILEAPIEASNGGPSGERREYSHGKYKVVVAAEFASTGKKKLSHISLTFYESNAILGQPVRPSLFRSDDLAKETLTRETFAANYRLVIAKEYMSEDMFVKITPDFDGLPEAAKIVEPRQMEDSEQTITIRFDLVPTLGSTVKIDQIGSTELFTQVQSDLELKFADYEVRASGEPLKKYYMLVASIRGTGLEEKEEEVDDQMRKTVISSVQNFFQGAVDVLNLERVTS